MKSAERDNFNLDFLLNDKSDSLAFLNTIADRLDEIILIFSYNKDEDKISIDYISPNIKNHFDIDKEKALNDADIFFERLTAEDRLMLKKKIKSPHRKSKAEIIKTVSDKYFSLEFVKDKNLSSDFTIIILDFISAHNLLKTDRINSKVYNQIMIKNRELSRNSYKIIKENSFIKRVLKSINAPFFVIDTESFEVIFSNQVFPLGEITPGTKYYEAVFGYEENCSISDRELCTASKVINSKSLVRVERSFTVEGERKDYEILVSPILNENKEVTHLVVFWNDITTKKIAEEKLFESEDRFRSVFEEAGIGMLLYDNNGQLINLNKSAVEVLDIIDLSYFYKLNMFDINNTSAEQKEKLYSGDEIRQEASFDKSHFLKKLMLSPCENKSDKYLSVNISPLFSKETKTVKNFLVHISDITLTKLAEDKLKISRVKAEQENKLKSDFLANVSHDLRTPLNAIINFSKVLSKGVLGEIKEEQKNIIDRINSSGKRLLLLINNLLDISKIESGSISLDINKVYLPDLKAVIDEAGASYKSDDVEIIFNMPESFFYTDKLKLEQIIFNLSSNAFKFTSTGHLKIEGSLKDDFLYVSFEDTGSGIETEDLESIFEKYSKSKPVSYIKGTGLGLAIVKELTKLLDGNVKVESQPGKGSTFTFYIKNYKNSLNTSALMNNKGTH
jgi:signal transduction histidine kinase